MRTEVPAAPTAAQPNWLEMQRYLTCAPSQNGGDWQGCKAILVNGIRREAERMRRVPYIPTASMIIDPTDSAARYVVIRFQ